MAIALLFICFLSIFIGLGILSHPASSKKEILLKAVLLFSVILVGITEALSLFKALDFQSIFITWGIVTALVMLYLFLHKEKAVDFSKSALDAISKSLTGLKLFEKILLALLALLLLLIFTQGVLYPPNNWDSMTYHMARISSWVSHRSVAHYPTHIIRQIYQPPFAEYVITHFDILNSSDLFSNSVQFFFLLFTLVSTALIVEDWGLGRPYKIMAIVLAATIPEVVLQASSTQNDIVVSFFIVATWYFAIKAVKGCKPSDYLFLGAAIGLALLTKGTAYLFLAPILLLCGITLLISLVKTKNFNYLWFSLITVFIAVSINTGHYYRNYKLTGSPLGVDKQESQTYSNQKMSPALLLSGMVKNSGLHMSLMYAKPIAANTSKIIYKLHNAAGIDINDPAVNYRNNIFDVKNGITDEDSAPNMLHYLLLLAAVIIIIAAAKKAYAAGVFPFFIIVVLQIIVFCLYLKWQPWNSRLHTPIFLIAVPLICYAFSIHKTFRKIGYIIAPVVLIYALLVSLHNDKRPYSNEITGTTRFQKYFKGNAPAYPEYSTVMNAMSRYNCKNIGLILGVDDWEYPLFNDCFSRQINPVYIKVDNLTKDLPQNSATVDCIVSTGPPSPFIDFNGKRFYNQTLKNKKIGFYKPRL
ncbi:ArnT family glycosyltransferase [Mucilaginibacter sp.]|uniref:ArnT family glycosyltransferase n=1 Tax=Mucilaginibacter sp. TaxID=1882438 RepID=UPI003D135638